MFNIYHEHFKVSYKPRGGLSWGIFLVCCLVVLIMPFIIGLAMQNFWIESNVFYQKPTVSFTERCALQFTTVLGQTKLWTCSEIFNQQFLQGSELAVQPFISIYEDDRDGDGKVDHVQFQITVPVYTYEDVFANDIYNASAPAPPANTQLDSIDTVMFLPEFDYNISHYLRKVSMTAAPLLVYRRASTYNPQLANSSVNFSAGPVCAITEADMKFYTTEKLINSPYVRYTNAYSFSPFVTNAKETADLVNLGHFAEFYTLRNQSVVVRVTSETEGGLELLHTSDPATNYMGGLFEDLGMLNSFTWRIRLRIPSAEVPYVPSYSEQLKWGWVQYFVIAYLLQWFLWKVRGVLVVMGLIDSTATYQVHHLRQ